MEDMTDELRAVILTVLDSYVEQVEDIDDLDTDDLADNLVVRVESFYGI